MKFLHMKEKFHGLVDLPLEGKPENSKNCPTVAIPILDKETFMDGIA